MNSNSQVIWQGTLADQHTLRVERTGEQQGVLYVLSPHEADLLVIGGIPLPSSGDISEDDIAVWRHIAEQGIAKLAERRAESPPSPDPSWDEEEIRAVQEMIAAYPLDTFHPSDRQQANRAILERIASEVEAHPYLRFGQLLTILGVLTVREAGQINDPFHEESAVTLARMKSRL